MKLDIYIKQNNSETSIVSELNNIKLLSLRKITDTNPTSVIRAVMSIILKVTSNNSIKYINIYCARKGMYLFLIKKEKDADLMYLNFLLKKYESNILHKKFSEMEFRFDALLFYFGTCKGKSIILKETTGNISLYKFMPECPKNVTPNLRAIQLLYLLLENEINEQSEIYFVLDNIYVADRLNQLLLSPIEDLKVASESYVKLLNPINDFNYLLLKCAYEIKKLNGNVMFSPKYQNKACRYQRSVLHE